MPISRSITLEWASSHYIHGEHDGVRVRIAVTCAENIDEEIFAYRLQVTDPTTGAKAAVFSHVCSPPDLVEWPRNAADPNSSPQWLRLSFVDVLVRSVAEAEEFVRLVQEDVLRLKRTFDNMGTLASPTTITFGSGCTDETPEESSSEEASESAEDWDTDIATVDAAANAVVFASQGGWVFSSGGPSSAPETVSSKAIISLSPGTTSHVLQITGFDLSEIDPAAELTAVTATISLRDATDGGAELGSIGSNSLGEIIGPQLSVVRLMAAGYSSNNFAAGEEIIGPEWSLMQATGEDLGLPVVTVADLIRVGLVLVIAVYVPFTGRASTVEVDGASLELTVRTRG